MGIVSRIEQSNRKESEQQNGRAICIPYAKYGPRRRQQWHPRQHDPGASCDVKVHDTTRVSEAAGSVFGEIDNRKHINRFHGCRVPSNSISNIIHAMHNLYSIFGSTELSSFRRLAKLNNLEL